MFIIAAYETGTIIKRNQMMLRCTAITALTLPIIASCTVTPVKMPENVVLTSGEQQFIETIDFDFQTANSVDKNRSNGMRCVLTNISNHAANLQGSSSTFTNPLTGVTQSLNKSDNLAGGNVLQGFDKESGFIAASGSTDYSENFAGLPIKYSIRFTALVSADPNAINIKFKDITRAQLDTGVAVNSGFRPVGAWAGAAPLSVYSKLESIATKLGTCIRE